MVERGNETKGHKLCIGTNVKYLGVVVSDDGSKPEDLSKTDQATQQLLKTLKPVRRDNSIPLGSMVKLMRSIVISMLL